MTEAEIDTAIPRLRVMRADLARLDDSDRAGFELIRKETSRCTSSSGFRSSRQGRRTEHGHAPDCHDHP